MRVKTQFMLTAILFAVILVIISASVIITNQQVETATSREGIANRIAQGASDLSYLSNDYLIYRESQQLSRWQARYASFSSDVAALRVEMPEQQVLVRNIQLSQQRMKEVFEGIVSGDGTRPGTASDPTFLQVSWSRMAVQTQGLVSDATRLAQMLRYQADQARQSNTIVILAMMGVFGAYFLANYVIVQRRLLQSIARLAAGTKVIGSGNLDFFLQEQRNDEIGELSHAFNGMTANLRRVMASKSDLEREITERQRAEADREQLLAQLQASNEELQRQSEEIHAANEELSVANEELVQETRIAEEALRARDEFLSVAAHELKTPVTSLRGFAQTIQLHFVKHGMLSPERLSRAVDVIDRQSSKLAKLVSQLLDTSRLEGGRLVLERRFVDLAGLVAQMADAAHLNSSRHPLVVKTSSSARAFVDPLRIEQVVTNLIDNAMRYSPNGGCVEISVEVRDGMVEIAVRDHGIGIPLEHRPHVFDRFYRAHEGGSIAGLGLGLYIAKEIVTLHGGSIAVESSPDGGTRFIVSLPVGDDETGGDDGADEG